MTQKTNKKLEEIRSYLLADLFEFAKYINPHYVYGDVHKRMFDELSGKALTVLHKDEYIDGFLLLLFPRGHLKSHCLAVWVVWTITKEPWSTHVYLSANDDLATVQMSAIKGMLTCEKYRKLWPNMINPQESKRQKWSTWAINIDHPVRKERGIRDYTLIIKTTKSSSTGLHCDYLELDDIVVPENAYTAAGRKEVSDAAADFISIKNTGSKTKAVGTLYDEKDIYHQWKKAEVPIWNEETGEFEGSRKQWRIVEDVVEDAGDGTGNFLWPRTRSPITGQWYGFDVKELASKKAEYTNLGHIARFYAQYYNNTDDVGSERVNRERFQYYDKKKLEKVNGDWYIHDKRLAIFAGMDLAWSDDTGAKNQRSDYTAIAIIGVDEDGFYYILDVIQFRTSKFTVYYNHVIKLHEFWGFKRIKIETNSGGKLVKKEIEDLVRKNGKTLVVDGKAVGRQDGTKEERHQTILEPRYEQKIVYHYEGGYIPTLEEQIIASRPKFDDLKDAVTIAMSDSRVPGKNRNIINNVRTGEIKTASTRFGGRRMR